MLALVRDQLAPVEHSIELGLDLVGGEKQSFGNERGQGLRNTAGASPTESNSNLETTEDAENQEPLA